MVYVEKNINEYSSLELAYIGDAVWELEIRKHFLKYGYNIAKLNKVVKECVNAKKQSFFYKKIIMDLDENLKSFAKRAKNSNIKSFPNSCSVMEYKEATAFEAIIGILYIEKKYDKIKEIIEKLIIKGD